MTDARYSPTLHRLAVLAAAATFPLIFMGGLVTSHGAGMSVPDWPNSYGYNMFTFPPSKWIGGIFYEHTHRLMGTVVGMLAIVLTVAAWKLESRRWVRWLATGFLASIIVQGILGGLRVNLINLCFAIVHACFAQFCFCLATCMVIVTSRWWHDAPQVSQMINRDSSRKLIALALASVLAVSLQLVVGAVMRHENAGLAIPDLPLAYGKMVPPTTAAELDAVNQQRAFRYQLDPVTMTQVWLAFSHRIGAIIVSIVVSTLCAMTLWKHRDEIAFVAPAAVLAMLLAVQATLGVLTVLLRKPADIASAHVAVGALLLATTVVIAARAIRVRSISPRALKLRVRSASRSEMEIATVGAG